MGPLTAKTPKPLLKVKEKTFLEYILDSFPREVQEVIIVVGYRGEKIKKFIGNTYKGKKIHYVFQKKLNGTGPALLLTKSYFKDKERFLIIYSDEFVTKKEVKECLASRFSWLSRYADIPENSGVITVSRGRIIKIVEKPKRPTSNLTAGGLMIVNTDIFQYKPSLHRTGEYSLTSMMNRFIKSHPVWKVSGKDNLYFTSPQDIDSFNRKSYKKYR